jgi:Zn-dependent peptidase ImmA (M78 family)
MIVTRKNLAREALDRALEVREEAKIAFNVALCVYGLCDRLGVRVQFVDINMEGLYQVSKRPLILLSSFRPLGRRVFNCGHELGHHLFGHGSTLDELQEEHQATSNSNPKEFLVNTFAGFLLMPPNAVRRAFADRKWNAAQATPEQCFRIACGFGIGYETLVSHLAHSLRMISVERASQLRRVKLPTIRRTMLGHDKAGRLVAIDEHHLLPTVDVEVGTHVLLPRGSNPEQAALEFVVDLPSGRLFKALRPGLVRVEAHGGEWAILVRISRYQYVGWSQYRHLEEIDGE